MARTPSAPRTATKRKPTPKKAAPPKRTRAKRVRVALDLDDKDIIPRLMELAQEQENARLQRAEDARNAPPRPPRAPVRVRPMNPPPWDYSYRFDEALPAEERASLTAFFERFTTVGDPRGVYVVGPDTPPEERRKVWDQNTIVVEAEQLRAHLPTDGAHERTARLERALQKPSRAGWAEAVMLLSTWDEATLAEAIAVADRALASWPDAARFSVNAWKHRPALRALTRVHWGAASEDGEPDSFEHVTVIQTQDVDWLEANQVRLAHVKHLHLSGKVGLPQAVLRLTALENLETLALQQPTYTSGTAAIDLQKLLKAPHLRKLKALSLYGYTLNDRSLKALASCAQPLERLRIEYGRMQPSAGARLADVAAKKRLKGLLLKYNDLGPEGAAALFARPDDWSSLRALDISANEIGDAGVAALTRASLAELRWLNLSSNDVKERLTVDSARALASTPALAKLETLIVHGHPIGGPGVAAVVESSHLRSLRAFNAGFPGAELADIFKACGKGDPVPITDLSLGNAESSKRADWARASFLRSVRLLSLDALHGNQYAGLFACPHLDALEVLVLGGCYVKADEALKALLAAKPPPSLRYLDMTGWKLTGEQAAALAASPLFQQLWGVELMTSYTPPEAWHAFYEAGVPLVNSRFEKYPANEYEQLTDLREEI